MTQFNHLREKLVVAASYHKPRHCSLKSMAKRPVFCNFCFFLGGKVKFRSKTAREVHGNGQDTAWSQSSNQTPRNKKWGITIQNVKYLAYCNLCMNLFPLLSNCLNSLIPPPSPPPPPILFRGYGWKSFLMYCKTSIESVVSHIILWVRHEWNERKLFLREKFGRNPRFQKQHKVGEGEESFEAVDERQK